VRHVSYFPAESTAQALRSRGAMRFSAFCLLLSLLVALPADAQTTAPREGLNDPNYRRNVAWAHRSLAGPRLEIAMGSIMMVVGPVIGLGMLFVNAFQDLIDCNLEETEAAEARCRQTQDADQRRRSIIGTTAVLSLTIGGGALFGHGVYSIRRIRVARRELDLEYARFSVRPEGGAELSLGLSF
jgi:hypothetical protein